jgi:hypothetical protein
VMSAPVNKRCCWARDDPDPAELDRLRRRGRARLLAPTPAAAAGQPDPVVSSWYCSTSSNFLILPDGVSG